MLTPKQRTSLAQYFDNENFEDKAALTIYPFRYETLELKDESAWQIGDDVIFSGTITNPISIFRKSFKKAFVRFEVTTDFNVYQCNSFNPYIKRELEGQVVTVVGKLKTASEMTVTSVSTKPLNQSIGIFPVYPLKGNLKQHQMRAIMKKLVKEQLSSIDDNIPSDLMEQYRLMSRRESLKQVHQPTSFKHLKYALRTLKYSEFLNYQTALSIQKKELQKDHKPPKKIPNKTLQDVLSGLPFELTEDQMTTLHEIIDDMKGSKTMARLIQGDVGSGKTIIAYISALIAVESGYQVAFLCPTEVLMKQHFQTFQSLLKKDITLSSLSSSLKSSEKSLVLKQLEEGDTDIVIGTHSLFSDSTTFKKLGLVIIDEQHRFGVQQRQSLIHKGEWVDTLMMSATPIPRTLASALYAHLDVSTIISMPSSRMKVDTILINQNSMTPIIDDILNRINQGDQCYVVCPAINDSKSNTRNVVEITANLQNKYGRQIVIDMIHGQMKSDEVSEVLTRFKNREIDMLVTTTIIEVGIHVGSANTMVIYDADRFGLAQIHQLRGRLGREGVAGLCYLLTKATDSESLKRLEYAASESDGFKLAYFDLQMRGSGDLLGQRQSGIPNFLLSDILRDQKILEQAKIDAAMLIASNNPQHQSYVSKVASQMDSILLSATI